MERHVLVCLAVVVAAAPVHGIFHFDFRTDMSSPFDGGYSRHDDWRRAALASTARVAKDSARLGRALGKGGAEEISQANAANAVAGKEGHWLTVGVGTPPQPAKMMLDTGSPLIFTQCMLFDAPKAKQIEPIFNPAKSSTFQVVPCGDPLCLGADFNNCTDNKCMYSTQYTSLSSEGVFASDTFSFGRDGNVAAPLGFGCGTLSGEGLAGASGIMGLSWSNLSLVTQLSVPRFSYCFTPFTELKTSPLLLGTEADLAKYKTTGPIQTVSLIKNPKDDAHYYVPMVGISLGARKLDVPPESLALRPDGSGGTVVVTASTMSYLATPAFDELKRWVLVDLKLPPASHAVKEYQLCFALPGNTTMDKVEVPLLRLHFDGGAEMALPRENYFQEPKPGLMCLAVAEAPETFFPNVISNVQQQNIHMLFDIRNSKLSFAPTQCDNM